MYDSFRWVYMATLHMYISSTEQITIIHEDI